MRSVSDDERTRADDNSDEKEHLQIPPCHRRSRSDECDAVIISIPFVSVVTSFFPFGMTTLKDEKIIEENVRSFFLPLHLPLSFIRCSSKASSTDELISDILLAHDRCLPCDEDSSLSQPRRLLTRFLPCSRADQQLAIRETLSLFAPLIKQEVESNAESEDSYFITFLVRSSKYENYLVQFVCSSAIREREREKPSLRASSQSLLVISLALFSIPS